MRLLALRSWLICEQNMTRLQRAFVVLLLLGSSHQLAQISWQLIPSADTAISTQSANNPAPIVSDKALQQQRLTAIHDAALFGLAAQTPNVVPTTAPKSRLNAQLTGVMASSTASRSIAIIAREGKQQSYSIGDIIQGSDAKITDILPDRVIISRQQQQEALLLDENGPNTPASSPIVKTASLPTARQQLLKNPGQLIDYLTIAPIKENNQLKGYRLNPGKNPELFAQIGLQPNDLATSINGLDLRNSSEAMQAMQQLAHQTEMNISVERNGETRDIYVNLAQP